MDVPISKSYIEYLLDAAETISTDNDIPKYISYRLFQEAGYRLRFIGDDENAKRLRDRVCQGFGDLTLRSVVVPGGPVPNYTDHHTEENGPIIKELVEFYLEYNEKNKIDEVEGSSETREKFLTTSKALRTALKMLIRVERGDTSEEDFIRVNGIPEEFVQDTKYDEVFIESSSTAAAADLQASRVNTQLGRSGFQGNMDFPSEWDFQHLIHAANVTSFEHDIYFPKYIPYRLLKEAEKTLENQIPTDYTQRLKSSIHKKLSVIKDKGIPACPKGCKENDSTIQVFVRFYSKFNEDEKIDQLCKDDEIKHTLILAKKKALRTALKMLIRVERGKTSEEDFIREHRIPEKDLQDTEYDHPTNWLPIENKKKLKNKALNLSHRSNIFPTVGSVVHLFQRGVGWSSHTLSPALSFTLTNKPVRVTT